MRVASIGSMPGDAAKFTVLSMVYRPYPGGDLGRPPDATDIEPLHTWPIAGFVPVVGIRSDTDIYARWFMG
jgi:hypothetical protein